MLKNIFTVLLLLIQIVMFAQSDFKPGFVITHNLDTLHGLIDYRGEIRNSKICVFKESVKSKEIKYGPQDIHSYRFNESKYYISKPINNDTVFLEYIVNGIVNLFFIRTPTTSKYYIEKDGKVMELSNEEQQLYIEGKGNYLKNTNKHIGLLKFGFADCPEIQSKINTVELTHKSLTNLAVNYHKLVCDGEKCIIYQKTVPFLKTRIIPLIGLEYSWLDKVNFEPSFSPVFGLILNNSLPRINEKLFFNLEASLSKHYYYAYDKLENFSSTQHIDYHYHLMYLKTNLALMYEYPKGKIRPTLEIGTGLNFNIDTDLKSRTETESETQVYTYVNNDISSYFLSSLVKAGVGAFYYSPTLIYYTNINYISAFDHKSVQLNIGVRF